MRILPEETQAMVIDMQERILPAMAASEATRERVELLVKGLRILEIPTMLTQQYTKGLGSSVRSVYEAAGYETVGSEEFFDKGTFSCMKDAAIAAALKERGRKNVIVCGIESHVCVLQTCIDLKEAGYQPILVVDAISSRRESDKQVALLRAQQEGILLTTSESILFELTVDSKHPKFKEISKLVK